MLEQVSFFLIPTSDPCRHQDEQHIGNEENKGCGQKVDNQVIPALQDAATQDEDIHKEDIGDHDP